MDVQKAFEEPVYGAYPVAVKDVLPKFLSSALARYWSFTELNWAAITLIKATKPPTQGDEDAINEQRRKERREEDEGDESDNVDRYDYLLWGLSLGFTLEILHAGGCKGVLPPRHQKLWDKKRVSFSKSSGNKEELVSRSFYETAIEVSHYPFIESKWPIVHVVFLWFWKNWRVWWARRYVLSVNLNNLPNSKLL